MEVFKVVFVAVIYIIIAVLVGVLVGEALLFKEKHLKLQNEVNRQKQDLIDFKVEAYSRIRNLDNELSAHKASITDLTEDKATTYDWLCELQDDLDDLKRWSTDTENTLNQTIDELGEVSRVASYRGY